MKKVKTIIKNNILGFIVGAILFGGIGIVYAATLLDSSKVTFSNGNMKSTNVQDAIDELNTTCTLAISASDTLKQTTTTIGDGLYADSTESGRYIYKGGSPNNYIKLGSDMYRIISIESDGTLKVIYNGTITSKSFDSTGYRDSRSSGAGGTYCVKSSYGCNAWAVNANFVNGSTSGTVLKDAELNTYLNSTWFSSISYSNFAVTHTWNVGAVDPEDESLQNSVSDEKKHTWSGKVGLMGATDYVKASSNSECTNIYECYEGDDTYNWIYKDIVINGNYPWTITPSADDPNPVFIVNSGDGYLSSHYAYDSSGVAPVLYLSSAITLSGKGTSSDPYIPTLK